ncbi:MAG: hypothetical protein ABF289_00695 [Clostridiales bacterium]
MNCEITDILKNIRTLKSQIEILDKMKLCKDSSTLINLALEELISSVFKYLNGDIYYDKMQK